MKNEQHVVFRFPATLTICNFLKLPREHKNEYMQITKLPGVKIILLLKIEVV